MAPLSAPCELAERLAPLRGPKHVVLISGGMSFGHDLLPLFDEFARKRGPEGNAA